MDSATQFVLGACVGAAVLGPRIGPRKAAIVGGLLGTFPDLDVYYPYEGPVDSFVLHRGPTHSLIMHALATPVFGEAILRIFRKFREDGPSAHRLRVYLAVFLCFSTHALLDAMTVYGTKLFWPLMPDPVGVGSVFIIDPLYTVPLLVLALWALFQGNWSAGYARGLTVALVLSTGYLGWSMGAQQIAQARAIDAVGGLEEGDRILAIPTPFNTLFWKATILRGDDYANIYVPILGGADDVRAYAHPRNVQSLGCALNVADIARVAHFSDDFIRLEQEETRVRIADLRMGLTPSYVFRFELADMAAGVAQATAPARVQSERSADGDVDWLLSGIAGDGVERPSEAGAELSLPAPGAWLPGRELGC